MPNVIKVDVAAKETGLEKIEKDARAAGKAVGDGIQKGMDEAENASKRTSKKIKEDLDEVKKSGRDAGDGLVSGFGEALDGIAATVGGSMGEVGGMLESGLSAAKGGVLSAGLALGGVLLDGLMSSWQADAVGGLVAAQTGATLGEAERLGDIAGDVFASNFGDSVEHVGQALTALFDNKLINTDQSEQSIERLTGKVLTLSQTTGDTVEEIANSAHQLIATGLASSVSDAFDMIQEAREQGLNASGDLNDTIQEYSTNFRTLGLSGEEAFGLLGQAVKAGARDTDFAADALKEFSILAQEVGGTAARGFEEIGLNAQEMSQKIAAGGKPAREALAQTLDALRNIQDPVLRNSAAVDLFGTKAEDLGDALYAMDLDTAAELMDEYGGSLERAQETAAATEEPLAKLGRQIRGLANDVIGTIQEMQDLGDTIDEEFGIQFGGSADEAADSTEHLAEKTDGAANAARGAADATEDYRTTLKDLIDQQREVADGVINLSEAQIENQQALTKAKDAAKEFAGEGLTAAKDGFNLTTEAGQEMQGAMNEVVQTTFDTIAAMREQNASSEETRAYLIAQREEFYNLLISMGLLPDAAQAITDKLLGMPDDVTPTVGIRDNASPTLDYLNRRLNELEARPDIRTDYYLYTHYMGNSQPGGAKWDRTGGLARGGVASAAELGTVYASGVPHAAGGGAQNAEFFAHEQGPELVRHPNGSVVVPHGMSERLMQGWGGGGVQVVLSMDGGDELSRAILKSLRVVIKNEHGGSSADALNARGVA